MAVGAHVYLLGKVPSPKILLKAFEEVKPNLILTVPLILEKIYKKMILPQLSKTTMKLALNIPLLDSRLSLIHIYKTDREYRLLLKHLDIRPEEFLMIGNSVRSDILPPLELGSYAVHIPYHTTWEHEKVDEPVVNPRFFTVDSLWDIISLLP